MTRFTDRPGDVERDEPAAVDDDRVLATVLFTDIVGSTRHASELGDRQWRALLDRHDQFASGSLTFGDAR